MTRVGIAIAAVVLALYVLPGQLRPDHFFQDDSYFYLQVASNIAAGEGSTFHGITPTNGYHPLWMPFCVLGLLLAGGDKTLGLHLVTLLQVLLFVGIVVWFRKTGRLIASRYWWVGVAPLAAFFLATTLHGSEAHLNGFLQTAAIFALLSARRRDGSGDWAQAGLLLGLAVLARLDNIFVVGWLVVFGLPLAGGLRSVRRILALGLPLGSVVAAYLVHNRIAYGHFVPISGALKSTFPRIELDFGGLGEMGRLAVLFGLAAVVLSLAFDRAGPRAWLLRALGCGTLTHAAYVVLFTRHHTNWMWYYVTGVLACAFGLSLAFDLAERTLGRSDHRPLRAAAALLAALMTAGGLAYAWAKAFPSRVPIASARQLASYRWPERTARWMKRNLPADSVVLTYDFPGTLAYYSDRKVLPTDGLINDYGYSDDLLALGVNRYLCDKGVGFYFGHILSESTVIGPAGELKVRVPRPGVQEIEVLAPLYRRPAGTIRIRDEDLVVRVKEIVESPEETPPLAFWKLDPCAAASDLG